MLATSVFCSVTTLVPVVHAYCESLLTVFVNALPATLLSFAVMVYSCILAILLGIIQVWCYLYAMLVPKLTYSRKTHTPTTPSM
jgi:hypothetical protein